VTPRSLTGNRGRFPQVLRLFRHFHLGGSPRFDIHVMNEWILDRTRMAGEKIYPVILCGGSGSRLWPLSRKDYPKQFAREKRKLTR
jgi:hypothetical protein